VGRKIGEGSQPPDYISMSATQGGDSSAVVVDLRESTRGAPPAVIAATADETRQLDLLRAELETINKSLAITGKKGIAEVDDVSQIQPGNSKACLFNALKECYNFSVKLMTLISPTQVNENKEHGMEKDTRDISADILRKLAESLPDMIKDAIAAKEEVVKPEEETAQPAKDPNALPTLFSLKVAVKKESEEDTAELITQEEWTKVHHGKVNKALKNIPVQKAGVRRDGTINIKFTNAEDLKEAEASLGTDYDVTASTETKKKLNPKLTIADIHEIPTQADLEREIYEKNENIRDLRDAGEPIKMIHYDVEKKFAVIQVSPATRESIRKRNDKIYLGLTVKNVRDRIHVIQCFHCQEYGHMRGSDYCKLKDHDPVCFYCAGKHKASECRNRKSVKCANCAKSRNLKEKSAAGTHNATDQLCPFFIREKAAVMSRTACCEETKNEYLRRTQDHLKKYGRV